MPIPIAPSGAGQRTTSAPARGSAGRGRDPHAVPQGRRLHRQGDSHHGCAGHAAGRAGRGPEAATVGSPVASARTAGTPAARRGARPRAGRRLAAAGCCTGSRTGRAWHGCVQLRQERRTPGGASAGQAARKDVRQPPPRGGDTGRRRAQTDCLGRRHKVMAAGCGSIRALPRATAAARGKVAASAARSPPTTPPAGRARPLERAASAPLRRGRRPGRPPRQATAAAAWASTASGNRPSQQLADVQFERTSAGEEPPNWSLFPRVHLTPARGWTSRNGRRHRDCAGGLPSTRASLTVGASGPSAARARATAARTTASEARRSRSRRACTCRARTTPSRGRTAGRAWAKRTSDSTAGLGSEERGDGADPSPRSSVRPPEWSSTSSCTPSACASASSFAVGSAASTRPGCRRPPVARQRWLSNLLTRVQGIGCVALRLQRRRTRRRRLCAPGQQVDARQWASSANHQVVAVRGWCRNAGSPRRASASRRQRATAAGSSSDASFRRQPRQAAHQQYPPRCGVRANQRALSTARVNRSAADRTSRCAPPARERKHSSGGARSFLPLRRQVGSAAEPPRLPGHLRAKPRGKLLLTAAACSLL
jgi:hypothetical protein